MSDLSLRDALEQICAEYEAMRARNEDVRLGADVVLKAIRDQLAAHPVQATGGLRTALEQYFSNGGPDTPIRTVWHDGVEHWEAPASDIRQLIEAHPAEPVGVSDEQLRGRLDQLWGWAKAGKQKDPHDPTVEYYLMDTENVDEFTRHVLDLVAELAQPARSVGVSDEAVRIAVRNKIAEWYGAEWISTDDTFYETDDTCTKDDEDEGAMHAYRGMRWTLEAAAPLMGATPRPTREQVLEHKLAPAVITVWEDPSCICGWHGDDFWEHYADAVLALMGGAGK